MRLTPEQAAAVHTHDRNVIVTAGAGSGKTRVLVERYLDLLSAHRDWPLASVVAITFTEKAAREMRDRVRATIEGHIAQTPPDAPSAEIDHWLERQTALTTARISTIHALCAQVLRAHPAEAGIDPGFSVLDETEAAILLDDAIEAALARLGQEDHPAAELLVHYEVKDVRRVLQVLAPSSQAGPALAALSVSPEDRLALWRAEWAIDLCERRDALGRDPALRDALNAVGPHDLPPEDLLADHWRIIHDCQSDLLSGEPDAFLDAVKTIAGIKLHGGSAKNWRDQAMLDTAKGALKIVRDAVKAAAKACPLPIGERDEAAARLLTLWHTAIQLAANTYHEVKDARAALDFDDLESRTLTLLEQHPSVADYYGEEFQHILVDEFQDTNLAQQQIVERLAQAGRAGAHGRLFVVGDPKQSIYAFRGADVSGFGRITANFTRSGGCELPLATSFRAHQRLIGAFNAVFARILQPGDGPAARFATPLERPMLPHRPSQPDRVVLHAAPLTIIALPEQEPKLAAVENRRWEAWEIAQHIHHLVRSGVLIWDASLDHIALSDSAFVPDHAREDGRGAYRPMDYGDVAVLFRAMTSAPLYEDVFKAVGVPYVTFAGKGYFDRQEVWDLLNLLRALHNPAHDLALASALRSPLFGLSDDALYALRTAQAEDEAPLSLWDALFAADLPAFPARDRVARAFACDVLRELRNLAGRVSDLCPGPDRARGPRRRGRRRGRRCRKAHVRACQQRAGVPGGGAGRHVLEPQAAPRHTGDRPGRGSRLQPGAG